MPLHFVRNDITKMETDAIVSCGNSHLRFEGGVSGRIFLAAGISKLAAYCSGLDGCKPGEAVLTPGFGLKAGYIIHTVGPVWRGGDHGEEDTLRSCYRSCLRLAMEQGFHSVAFPLIASGSFGYPNHQAVQIAIDEINLFLAQQDGPDMSVTLVLYSQGSYLAGTALLGEIESYITETDIRRNRRYSDRYRRDRYEPQSDDVMADCCEAPSPLPSASITPPPNRSDRPVLLRAEPDAPARSAAAPAPSSCKACRMPDLPGFLDDTLPGFSPYLMELIDRSGETDSAVYHRANIDRKLFSKIRSNPDYQPKKTTVFAFCLALKLNIDTAQSLLDRAGYSLSDASKVDRVIKYCLINHIFNVVQVDLILFDMNLPQISSAH